MGSRARSRAFTTLELVIAVVIAGLLAMVAMPFFMDQIRKGRRTDAFSALAGLQQAQERWRSSNGSYAGASLLTTTPGLGLNASSSSSYYTMAITAADDTSYTASATAVTGGAQAADTRCTTLWIRMQAGNVYYGAGSPADWSDPYRCWTR